MSYLESLFTKYGTDKGIWGYTPAYEKYLEKKRLRVHSVLEIGICGHRDIPNNVIGASLFAWRDYFPHAHIVGIDNDSKWMVNGEARISTYCCDAYDRSKLFAVLDYLAKAGLPNFDFICDDAVHDPIPQLNLISDLMPAVRTGGVYAVEDVCPYKLPHNNLDHMLRHFPRDTNIEEFTTHKDERLLIVTRS